MCSLGYACCHHMVCAKPGVLYLTCLTSLPPSGHHKECFSTGMQARRTYSLPNGKIRLGPRFTSSVVLLNAQMDRVGKGKVSGADPGNNTIMACTHCAMTGVYVKNFTRQLGYDEPIEASMGKCKGEFLRMGCNDERRLFSDQANVARAIHTEQQHDL